MVPRKIEVRELVTDSVGLDQVGRQTEATVDTLRHEKDAAGVAAGMVLVAVAMAPTSTPGAGFSGWKVCAYCREE